MRLGASTPSRQLVSARRTSNLALSAFSIPRHALIAASLFQSDAAWKPVFAQVYQLGNLGSRGDFAASKACRSAAEDSVGCV